LIFKFEKTFEKIRKNKRYYRETLKRYNFRKPKREAGLSEQVDPISIFNFEERSKRTICNKNKKCHYIKKSLPRIKF